MYFVYRFLDKENKVIYVGRTGNLKTRLNQHFNAKDKEILKRNKEITKIDYIEVLSKNHSHMYEIQMIDFYKPKYNKDFIEGDISDILIEFNHLDFNELSKEMLRKLKYKKTSKVSSKILLSLNKYDSKTVNYYMDTYDFSETESYMILKMLYYGYGQCFYVSSIVDLKERITFDMVKNLIDKLMNMKFLYKLSVKSEFSTGDAYSLEENFIYKYFEL